MLAGVPSGYELRRGDVVFADWDDGHGNIGTDGHLDHAMGIDDVYNGRGWNQVFMSYHTTDTYHLPLSVVQARAGGYRIAIVPRELLNSLNPDG